MISVAAILMAVAVVLALAALVCLIGGLRNGKNGLPLLFAAVFLGGLSMLVLAVS